MGLADLSNEPLGLDIEGEHFDLKPLGPGDIAAAEKYIRSCRLSDTLGHERVMRMAPELIVEIIAKQSMQPIRLTDILFSADGRDFLIRRSCGKSATTLSQASIVYSSLLRSSGLTGDDAADPTITPETATGGNGSDAAPQSANGTT